MKIFSVIGYGSFCGGMAIVAAENEESAMEMIYQYQQIEGNNYNNIDYGDTLMPEMDLIGIDGYITEAKVLKVFEYAE